MEYTQEQLADARHSVRLALLSMDPAKRPTFKKEEIEQVRRLAMDNLQLAYDILGELEGAK